MASEAVVGPTPGKAKLTLATCNSFGSKDDRFIVEASLIDSKKI
jgi:sortase (surface protein transpeptidase)